MDTLTLILQFTLWQLIHFFCKTLTTHLLSHPSIQSYIPSKTSRTILLEQSAPYLVSTLHALFVTPRGLQHIFRLLNSPTSIKLLLPTHQVSPEHTLFAYETQRVLFTNATLAGYLLADLTHVLYHYPKLGSWDTVLHHLSFFFCASIAGWYGMYPFMFGWLILGETSTPFLNLRWFLIKAGKGSTKYFRAIEITFVALFVLTRFFLYGAGLAHQLSIVSQLQGRVPTWAIVSTMTFVIAGFLLNLVWIRKMYRLAKGSGKKPSGTTEVEEQERQRVTQEQSTTGTKTD